MGDEPLYKQVLTSQHELWAGFIYAVTAFYWTAYYKMDKKLQTTL